MKHPNSTRTDTTAPLPLSTMAGELLERLGDRLRQLDDPALRRELDGLLRPVERAVRRWVTVAPREEQAKACLELLLEIEARLPADHQSGPR